MKVLRQKIADEAFDFGQHRHAAAHRNIASVKNVAGVKFDSAFALQTRRFGEERRANQGWRFARPTEERGILVPWDSGQSKSGAGGRSSEFPVVFIILLKIGRSLPNEIRLRLPGAGEGLSRPVFRAPDRSRCWDNCRSTSGLPAQPSGPHYEALA